MTDDEKIIVLPWTDAEKAIIENTIDIRINRIKELFPGRTIKEIAAKRKQFHAKLLHNDKLKRQAEEEARKRRKSIKLSADYQPSIKPNGIDNDLINYVENLKALKGTYGGMQACSD